VASVNYTDDVPIGKNMLAQLSEVYRKLRNTARFMLGNLTDFDPAVDTVKYEDLTNLDKFILHRLQEVLKDVVEDFDNYEFFKYYQLLQNFCVVDLSSFFFDIAKDRLYTSGSKSQSRRACQTVLNELLQALVRLLVPVTPHMAEDIWQHMPEAIRHHCGTENSVLLTDFPTPQSDYLNDSLAGFWKELIEVRYTVNKALEEARAGRKIGSSLEASVCLEFDGSELADKVLSLGHDLPGFFITSQAKVGGGNGNGSSNGILSEVTENGVRVKVFKAEGTKCPRCWKYSQSVGSQQAFEDLCEPCATTLASC
ncbi:MAG: class I tRNA ligase family protein, partial [Cyanobacteria bacterium]|nr:class I tRNA ligase family protein [Cyanobacteriota bacterium]